MLRSNTSVPPTRRLGSSRKSLFSYTLLTPGMITPPLTTGRAGTVMWLPSTPMRKLVFGSPPASQTPARLGVLHTERSPKPIPSAGVSTRPTPLRRSNARPQPARTTVFLFPNSIPIGPSEKPGFQATAKRGPQFV